MTNEETKCVENDWMSRLPHSYKDNLMDLLSLPDITTMAMIKKKVSIKLPNQSFEIAPGQPTWLYLSESIYVHILICLSLTVSVVQDMYFNKINESIRNQQTVEFLPSCYFCVGAHLIWSYF